MSTVIRIFDTGTTPADTLPEGVDVLHRPALVRRALPLEKSEIRQFLKEPHHIIFYSRFAVDVVVEAALIDHADKHHFWVVGRRTAAAVIDHFHVSVEVPDDEQFTGLINTLSRCDNIQPIVAFGLAGTDRDLGPIADDWKIDFTAVPVYESTANDATELVKSFRKFQPHWLTVTSSRGVRAVANALGIENLRQVKIAAIGPSTADTLAELGLDADLVPTFPDRVGLLRAIARS